MGSTPVCTVGLTGISRPTLADCLAYFTTGYQGIYPDSYVASDAQDGQFMGLLGAALDDFNQTTVSVYNSYSPATAQGTGLSSVVKINGLTRPGPTYSTVPVLVVGQAYLTTGTIQNSDGSGNVWSVPPVTIPAAGQITATATCTTLGAVNLASGVTLTIMNPTRGLQSVTTTAAASAGLPVETDYALRQRQSSSTQTPSSTMLGSIVGALSAIPSVGRINPYQNETAATDSNGVPGYCIAMVVDGGDATAIATAIQATKFACGTYGTTTETIVDSIGVSHAINFFYTTDVAITWAVTLSPKSTFSTNTIALIQASLAAWTNSLTIGQGIQITRAMSAAYLAPSIAAAVSMLQTAVAAGDTTGIATYSAQLTSLNAASLTYEITSLMVARGAGTPAASDVTISYNEAATITVDAYGNPVSSTSVVVTI